jgi:hypothetical protein
MASFGPIRVIRNCLCVANARAVLLMLAGAFLFLFALLCTIPLLAESHCGDRFGYYGCDLH